MGSDHVERLALRTDGVVLAGVADPDASRARSLADRLGTRVFGDPIELVTAPDVDAVLLASPGLVHEEQVLACLGAGKPVLCEKPLAMDDASARRVVDAEVALGRRLVTVGFMRRFDPEYAAVKEALGSGVPGRLLLLHHTHRNVAAPHANFSSEMIVRDSLVHEVDVSRFLFGEEITEVTVLSPAPTSYAGSGVIDPQVAIFRLSGGGLVTAEVFINSQVAYEVSVEAVAEQGSLTAGRSSAGHRDFRTRFAPAYDLEVQAWADAVRAGRVPRHGASAWDGYAATAVSTAALASLASGMPVPVTLPPMPALYVGDH
jgi:myo-inositol 2-dehydrogenase/D-chiro-inositol 1-dehydrogenase